MFNIGPTELGIVLVIALIVIGLAFAGLKLLAGLRSCRPVDAVAGSTGVARRPAGPRRDHEGRVRHGDAGARLPRARLNQPSAG